MKRAWRRKYLQQTQGKNNNSEGFCGWQARWMMIRKNDFSYSREGGKNAKGRRETCERHALDGKSEKKYFQAPSYILIFSLNCQRSIFLTVPLFFQRRAVLSSGAKCKQNNRENSIISWHSHSSHFSILCCARFCCGWENPPVESSTIDLYIFPRNVRFFFGLSENDWKLNVFGWIQLDLSWPRWT